MASASPLLEVEHLEVAYGDVQVLWDVGLDTRAGKLSGGEQQMAAIGRALMARPRLLMVDELSLGLAPVLVESLMETIGRINRDGTTILMVEQDVQTALEVASRGYVIETGQITLGGRS